MARKYRICRDGHGKYFIQRKFLWWWWDYELPINEFSDARVTFKTEKGAMDCVHELMGYDRKYEVVRVVNEEDCK